MNGVTIVAFAVLYVLALVPVLWIARAEIRKERAATAVLRKSFREIEVELQHEKQRHASCRKTHTFDLPAVEPRAADPVWRDKSGHPVGHPVGPPVGPPVGHVIPLQRGAR